MKKLSLITFLALLLISCEKKEESTSPLVVNSVVTNVANYGESTGSITLTVSGGKEPYTYSWSNGANTKDLTSIPAGSYNVLVTDNKGDTVSSRNTVVQPTELFSYANNQITRLQQSGIIITSGDKIIYIDPINTTTTGNADIILITHSHSDHYVPSVITSLLKASTKILVPGSIYTEVKGLTTAENVYKIKPDTTVIIDGINIEVVPAYNANHELPNSVGYILTLDGKRIYHSGDTKRIPEMTSFNVDIACLPMGQTYTFASIEEAAQAARDIKAKVVVPIHYGLYEGTNNDPNVFAGLLGDEVEVCIKASN